MQLTPVHTIRKQTFNVKHIGSTDAFTLQADAEQFCKKILLPKIEELMSNYDHFNETIYLDKLQVNVNSRSVTELNIQLADEIINELKQSMNKKIESSASAIIDEVDLPLFDAFLFYLHYGYIKHGSYIPPSEMLQRFLQSLNEAFTNMQKQRLINALKFKSASERLVNMVDESEWWMMFEGITNVDIKLIQDLQKDALLFKAWLTQAEHISFMFAFKSSLLQALNGSNDSQFQNHAADIFVKETSLAKKVANELKDALVSGFFKYVVEAVNSRNEETINTKDKQRDTPKELDYDKIFVPNAGLVIAATFLPRFFANINLSIDNERDELRALSLMHYIATGSEQAEEWQLVLPKLFLGIPFSRFVLIDYAIIESDKQQVRQLLEAIITNWSILKNTAIDGLRQSFLQRNGVLSFKDDKWNLDIEAEAYDLLLDHLPWQISMIKLPWMEHLLQVHWRD